MFYLDSILLNYNKLILLFVVGTILYLSAF